MEASLDHNLQCRTSAASETTHARRNIDAVYCAPTMHGGTGASAGDDTTAPRLLSALPAKMGMALILVQRLDCA